MGPPHRSWRWHLAIGRIALGAGCRTVAGPGPSDPLDEPRWRKPVPARGRRQRRRDARWRRQVAVGTVTRTPVPGAMDWTTMWATDRSSVGGAQQLIDL